MKYAWIGSRRGEFPVALMCQTLGVSRSGYYGWAARKPGRRTLRREKLAEAARKYHERSHGIYGYRKVHADIVQEERLDCCLETVRRAMRREGLFSRVKRKFVRTTDSGHGLPVAGNALGRGFAADGPNRKWAADITYVATREGWLYLATVEDLYSRRIVGWSMSEEITAELVRGALAMALTQRCPGEGLLHHSDRGVQYASELFQDELRAWGIECSMSRRGNCWDNAPQESFFGKLKAEWIRGRVYETRQEARKDIFIYLEVFYNRVRRHAALGYVSPAEFERRGQEHAA